MGQVIDREVDSITIGRVNRLAEVSSIYHGPFLHDGLDMDTRGFLITMLVSGETEFSMESLLGRGWGGRERTRKWIRQLLQAGYARRVQTHNANGTFRWELELYNVPPSVTFPSMVQPSAGQPPTANPYSDAQKPDSDAQKPDSTSAITRRVGNDDSPPTYSDLIYIYKGDGEQPVTHSGTAYEHFDPIEFDRQVAVQQAIAGIAAVCKETYAPGTKTETAYTQAAEAFLAMGGTQDHVNQFAAAWAKKPQYGGRPSLTTFLQEIKNYVRPLPTQAVSADTAQNGAADTAWREVMAWLSNGMGKANFTDSKTIPTIRAIGGQTALKGASDFDLKGPLKKKFVSAYYTKETA